MVVSDDDGLAASGVRVVVSGGGSVAFGDKVYRVWGPVIGVWLRGNGFRGWLRGNGFRSLNNGFLG